VQIEHNGSYKTEGFKMTLKDTRGSDMFSRNWSFTTQYHVQCIKYSLKTEKKGVNSFR